MNKERTLQLKVIFFLLIMVLSSTHAISQQDQLSMKEDVWYLNTSENSKKNVEIFVKEMGAGDTVVVVHGGFGAEHSYLLDLFKGMERDYHFVFYDQRGSLRSPAPDSLVTAMSHVDDIETLRKELGIEKLNLFGHSMGSWICSAYLDKYPERVAKLTLMGLVWEKSERDEEDRELENQAEEGFSAFMARSEVMEEMAKNGLAEGKLNSKQKTYRWRIRFASANTYDISKWRKMKGGWVFYDQSAGTAAGKSMPQHYDWVETFKNNSRVKISVINGSHDLVDFGGKVQSKWLKTLPNVRYHLVDKAAHNPWIDQPTQVRRLLYMSL